MVVVSQGCFGPSNNKSQSQFDDESTAEHLGSAKFHWAAEFLVVKGSQTT